MSILPDGVLLESKSAREEQLRNISYERSQEILNQVKFLLFPLWQGVGITTTEQIADFYEVGIETIHRILKRHKSELNSDGLKNLKGKARSVVTDILSLDTNASNLIVWTPRAALRAGMLLRDSAIAAAVRTTLLEAGEKAVSAQSQELERLRLENQNLFFQVELCKQNNAYLDGLGLLASRHGLPGTMALLGRSSGIVEVEKTTIEVIDDKHNVSFKGQTLKQVRDYLKTRYGLKFKSDTEIKNYLKQLGQEGLIGQTKRSVLSDYIPEENLEEVYQILTGGNRQLALGE